MLAFCLVRVLTLFIANPALPPLNAVLMFPLGWTFVTFAGRLVVLEGQSERSSERCRLEAIKIPHLSSKF